MTDEAWGKRFSRWTETRQGMWGFLGVTLAVLGILVAIVLALWPSESPADPVPNVGIGEAQVTPEANALCSDSSEATLPVGWGPDRPMYEDDTFPDYLTFNSTAHNENLGDERNWVRIKADGVEGATYADSYEARPGQVYQVSAYVRLDGPVNQVADETRIKFNLPTCTGHAVGITGLLSSVSAHPIDIWDGTWLWAREDFNLAYVPDSAELHNNFGTFPLSESLLTAGGELIGVEQMDGEFRPGYGNSAYINFKVRPQFAGE